MRGLTSGFYGTFSLKSIIGDADSGILTLWGYRSSNYITALIITQWSALMNSISRCGARLVFSLLLFLVVDLATNSVGTPGALGQNIRPVTITRLFWQDRETAKLSYADLVTTNKWNLNRGWVSGFQVWTLILSRFIRSASLAEW